MAAKARLSENLRTIKDSVAGRENFEQIVNLVKGKDLYVLTGEVYRELLWDDEPYTSIASLPRMKERTLVVDSFSKTYAMTGLPSRDFAARVLCVLLTLLMNTISKKASDASKRL